MNRETRHQLAKTDLKSELRLYVEIPQTDAEKRAIARIRSEFGHELKGWSLTPIPNDIDDNDDDKDDTNDIADNKDRDDEGREWVLGEESVVGGCDIEDWDEKTKAPKFLRDLVRAPESKTPGPTSVDVCKQILIDANARMKKLS